MLPSLESGTRTQALTWTSEVCFDLRGVRRATFALLNAMEIVRTTYKEELDVDMSTRYVSLALVGVTALASGTALLADLRGRCTCMHLRAQFNP